MMHKEQPVFPVFGMPRSLVKGILCMLTREHVCLLAGSAALANVKTMSVSGRRCATADWGFLSQPAGRLSALQS